MKKIKFNLKYFIIIFLLGLTVNLNANPIKDKTDSSRPSTTVGIDNSINSIGGFITFYGEVDIFSPTPGSVIIDCHPPYNQVCYTLIWDSATPNKKTIILNDKNHTKFMVTSDPVITTGKNGDVIHTFAK